MQRFPATTVPATGYFERVDWREGHLSGSGWMLNPEHPVESIRVAVNGSPAGTAEPSPRLDVKHSWPWIRHAADSGFSFLVECGAATGRIDLYGERGGLTPCRMSTFFAVDRTGESPTPPHHLSERATMASGPFLRLQGLRIFTDLYDQIERFAGSREGLQLLDWGCGSGRTTAHFISILKAQVSGADMDSEAIAWCNRHLPGGAFSVIGCEPPLPYRDQSFDVVVACSVFTHLTPDHQRNWLRELHRVMRPNGILLATTHGDFAYTEALNRPGRGRARRLLQVFLKKRLQGFVDHGVDRAFDGIAPPGYYRNVYQSRRHTIERWTERFETLDYIERGVDGFQDLVVLRPK